MSTMTKDDYIWVAIRIFGIYLIVLAITGIPGLVSSAFKMFSWWSVQAPQPTGEPIDTLLSLSVKITGGYTVEFIHSLIRVGLYYLIGMYFIRGGKYIHDKIAAVPAAREEGASA